MVNQSSRVILLIFTLWGMTFASERCVMSFSACPDSFNNKTILVPDKVVGIAPSILACKDSKSIAVNDTPSILFIIDNSGSMFFATNNSTPASDPSGARFNVTRDLLDSIAVKWPHAEVGLVVFRQYLVFDTNTTQPVYYKKYFKTLSRDYYGHPSQAYIPFLTLNQSYDSRTGLTILKDILQTKTFTGRQDTIDLVYRPDTSNAAFTNINAAFFAAREAFANAVNAKNKQFIVFLSDGVATQGESLANGIPQEYYRDSTKGVPTTFTIFLTANNTAPQTIRTMTQNIQNNGYSSSNPLSNYFSLQASYQSLMTTIMQNVINQIHVDALPLKMVLNNVTSNNFANGNFVFPDSFFLGNAATQFSMQVTYRYTNPTTNTYRDTVETINFSVQKSSTASNPSGIVINCSTVPDAAIPVIATVLDTNKEGHIDKIDLSWTDTAQIRTTMPDMTKWILSLTLVTADGAKISLRNSQIIPDIKNKTIHIIINENSDGPYETNVNIGSSAFVLSDTAMTVSGRPFTVANIVDNAGPVIKSACFSPSTNDSIKVTFTENVPTQTDPKTLFTLLSNGVPSPVIPINIVRQGDKIFYVYLANTINDKFSIKDATRSFALALCGDVSIVKDYHVASNPFIPGETNIPSNQQDQKNPIITGTRIEVSLIKAVQQQLETGSISGKVIIFDAVGNTVLEQKTMSVDVKSGVKLFWNWDGKTSKGVTAGAGTYVARIYIENTITGQKQTIRQIIGLKHK